MLARGWEEVPVEGGTWEFCYADVGWIHEFITYTVRRPGGATAARLRQ